MAMATLIDVLLAISLWLSDYTFGVEGRRRGKQDPGVWVDWGL